MLAIVEQQQKPPVSDNIDEGVQQTLIVPFRNVQDFGHRLHHQLRIRQRRQIDKPGAIRILVYDIGRGLQGDPGFARASGSYQRDQPVRCEERLHFLQFFFSADEARELEREIVKEKV